MRARRTPSPRDATSYYVLKRRTFHPLWTWREERIIDRYARAILKGRYRSTVDAAPDCREDLNRLSTRHPNAPWAFASRPIGGIRIRLIKRACAFGGRWAASNWHPAEQRVAKRHAQRFLDGRHASVADAARACHDELNRLDVAYAGSIKLTSRRSKAAVHSYVLNLTRQAGWNKPDGFWSTQEKRVMARYARGVVAGRWPTVTAAAHACVREFDRLRRRWPAPDWLGTRKWLGVYKVMRARARTLRGSGLPEPWTDAEKRLADRYARQVVAGRYKTVRSAAKAFVRKQTRRDARIVRPLKSVIGRIRDRSLEMGRTPRTKRWTDAELRTLARYAWNVTAGRHRSLHAAARAYVRDNRSTRTLRSVFGRMRILSEERGWQNRNRWNAAERKVRDRWVRWYERHHRQRRQTALGEAAAGLRQELAGFGFPRTHSSCLHQISRTHARKRAR